MPKAQSLHDYLDDNFINPRPKAKVEIAVPKTKAILYVSPTPETFLLSKRLEGRRRWSAKGLTFIPTEHNYSILRKELNIIIEDPFLDLEELQDELHDLKTEVAYVPKTTPYEFQDHATDLMRKAPNRGRNFALFCEPGTGKSKMAIDRIGELFVNKRIRACIIVAPKGVHNQWVEEQIPTHCSPRYFCYAWQGSLKKLNFRRKRKDCLVFLSINYDALRTPNGWNTVQDFIKVYHGLFGIIFDESHLIKNDNSIRWDKCNDLARHDDCYTRLLLTGTPIAKNLLDEWAQFKILDESIIGIQSKRAFKNMFCELGGRNNNQIVGPRNLDQFKALTDPYIYRARKRDLAGMPEKVYERWRFDLSKDLRDKYKEMAIQFLLEIEEDRKSGKKEAIVAQNAMVKVLKLQQITNGFLRNEKKQTKWLVPFTENSRLIALLECLDSHIPQKEKVIIWCRFRADIDFVSKYLPHSRVFHGGLSTKEKRKNLKDWMDKKSKCKYFIATPASGGTGLNLQKSGCKYAVYYSNSENSIQRWQSEDRIHRIGADATQPVIYIDLVAKNTRDIAILANLRAKKQISDIALDDIVDSIKETL